MKKKNIFLAIIVFISIAAFYGIIPPTILVGSYGMLAVVPLVFIFLKKNLVNTLMFWIVLSLFYNFGKVPLPMLPDISPERIIWATIMLYLFIDVFFKKRKIDTSDLKIETVMFLFIIYLFFSEIFGGTFFVEGHGVQLNYLLSGYGIPFSIFFLGKNLIDDEQKIRKVFLFLCIIGLYLGLTGIFEHFILSYLVFPQYIMKPGLGIHWGQSRGPFLNAHVNGLTIGLIFFISWFLYQSDKNKWKKRLMSLSMLSMLITLLFTYNRAAWIGFAVASLLIPIYSPKVRKLYFIGLLLIIGVSFAFISMSRDAAKVEQHKGALEITEFDTGGKILHRFKSADSVEARLRILEASWEMFLAKPLLGFGYKTFKKESVAYFSEIRDMAALWDVSKQGISVHNTMVQLLVELGSVGFSLFLFILFYPLVIAIKLYHISPPDSLGKELAKVCFANFIFYFILMQGMEYDFLMFPNTIYYLNMGIMTGVYQRYREDMISMKQSA